MRPPPQALTPTLLRHSVALDPWLRAASLFLLVARPSSSQLCSSCVHRHGAKVTVMLGQWSKCMRPHSYQTA